MNHGRKRPVRLRIVRAPFPLLVQDFVEQPAPNPLQGRGRTATPSPNGRPLRAIGNYANLWRMKTRLLGMVATLWFFFALASLFIAAVLSPMGLSLLLPDRHPSSWLYPALLSVPPIVLLGQHFLSARLSKTLLWPLAVALGLFAFLLFAFLASFFFAH